MNRGEDMIKQLVVAYSVMVAALVSIAVQTMAAAAQNQGIPKQTVTTEDGGIFMEEVDSKRPDQQGSKTAPKVEMKRAPSVSELGVPVTTSGRIVPLIQQGSPVMQMGSHLQMYREPGVTAVPWWSGAAGLPGTVPYSPGFGVPCAGAGYYPGLSSPYGAYSGLSNPYPYPYGYPGLVSPYSYGGGYYRGMVNPYNYGYGYGLGYNPGYYVSPGASAGFRIGRSSVGFSIGGAPRWVSPYSYGSSILSPLLGY